MNECAKAMLNHYNGSECIHLHLRSFMNTGIRLVFTLCRYIIYYSSHALVHTHSSADGTFECQLPMLRLHTHPAATKLLELFFNRVHLATMFLFSYTLSTKLVGTVLFNFSFSSARFFSHLLILLIG